MSQSGMSYHHSAADYSLSDSWQTSASASTHNPTAMMYNIRQVAGQSIALNNTSQQFSQQQPASLQMTSAEVAAPYFSSEPTNTAAASVMQAQTASSSTQPSYLQNYSASGIVG
ncbi:hypothetical protein B0H63DRAFT_533368 [Podospora didyma]|uniref:Uncharacterized protein n=1 Tax=Podospora didyma TaxID=330526 RepID=A0AAE0P7Z5_9PEZI|nr:hypothetical protein B0H63DRAFT_533368 [Podospora didyma]